MKALGLYIFAGGFTLGVKKHFDVVAHLDVGYGAATMARNQPEIPVFVDPETWPTQALRELGPYDLVYGNPPCAAWSPIGRIIQQGNTEDQWRSDERVDCTRIHFNALRYFEPTVWIWESVPQAYTRGRPLVDELTRLAVDLGYGVDYVLHNAMYLGTPQHRKRFMMVCSKVDIDWECDFKEPPTVGEVLGKYKAPKVQDPISVNLPEAFIRSVPPGKALRQYRDEYLKKHPKAQVSGISFALKKLHPDKVAGAMIGPKLVHPTEPRMLTVQEMLAFSGFPLTYKLTGSGTAQASEIGRGVMPPVGEWFARNIKKAIERERAIVSGRVREIDYFKPPGSIKEIVHDDVS